MPAPTDPMPKFPQHQRLSAVHLAPSPVPARHPISPPHPRCVRAELHSPSLRDLRKPPAMLQTSSEEERERPRDVFPRGRHEEVLAPIAMVRHRGNLQRLPYLPSKLPGCRMSFLTMESVRMALDFLLAGLSRSIESSGYSHLKADPRSTPSRSVRHCVHRRPPSATGKDPSLASGGGAVSVIARSRKRRIPRHGVCPTAS